ncbi:hypothetical protein ACHAPO_011573 [Fusarium lateritium]
MALGQISMVASQPLELALRADKLCSSGDVEFTDLTIDMFTGFAMSYCKNHKLGDDADWSTGLFNVNFTSSTDGCLASTSMSEQACMDSFNKIIDSCPVGSKISGGKSVWTLLPLLPGPNVHCIKFSIQTEKLEVLKTDFAFHLELNQVDIGKDLYSCDDYMKLFDSAKKDCLSGVDDTFKGYLDQLRGVIAGSCEAKPYEEYSCGGPGHSCGNAKRVKVKIPSFIGASTAKGDETFVANYKVSFTQSQVKSPCDVAMGLLSAGIGTLPLGSLFDATSIACPVA